MNCEYCKSDDWIGDECRNCGAPVNPEEILKLAEEIIRTFNEWLDRLLQTAREASRE